MPCHSLEFFIITPYIGAMSNKKNDDAKIHSGDSTRVVIIGAGYVLFNTIRKLLLKPFCSLAGIAMAVAVKNQLKHDNFTVSTGLTILIG